MRSVRLVAFGIILIIVGATSPLYVMLLTSEDDTAAAVEVPLISEEDDTVDAAEDPLIGKEDVIGAEDKCLQGKFAIPVPDGSLYWQDALLCGKDMRYWMGGAEPPGPIINRSRQEFN